MLVEDYGLDQLKAKVTRPLSGLRVGPFYGCYVIRPRSRIGYDEHPERDLYLEQVIEALGGEAVEYDGARKCCGFPVITMNRDTSLRQAGTHIGDALDAGADCLVTPCPLCHLNLDMQQPEAAKVTGASSAWRCCTCRSSSGWRSASSRRSSACASTSPPPSGSRSGSPARSPPERWRRAARHPRPPKPPPEVEQAVLLGHIDEAVSLYVHPHGHRRGDRAGGRREARRRGLAVL